MAKKPVAKQKPGIESPLHRFEISGDLDVHAIEALRLEIGRLAARHGAVITTLRVAPARQKSRTPQPEFRSSASST